MKEYYFTGTFYRNRLPQLVLLFSLCLGVSAVQIAAQDYKTLKDGLEYAEVTKEISGLKVNMNLLRLDLTKVRLDVHHAMDAAIGTEKTSSIATRHGAFAAINAGFFRLDNSIWAGDAAGTLIIDKKLLSESRDARSALGFINGPLNTEAYFGHPTFQAMVTGEKNNVFPAAGVNRQRGDDEIIAYTPEFGRTTLTNPFGIEVVVSRGRITKIKRGGSSPIPSDGFVISFDGKDAGRQIKGWRVGGRVELSTTHTATTYDNQRDIEKEQKHTERLNTFDRSILFVMEDITNGVPQLLKDGKIDITWEQEKATKSFVETRHPRTAVAKLKDGKFLMITVDGRTESSGGIGLQDLAEYLLSLGATDAMNLDGGGSTTMFLDGKVVNHPSDKEGERKVSDAILVTPRAKPKNK